MRSRKGVTGVWCGRQDGICNTIKPLWIDAHYKPRDECSWLICLLNSINCSVPSHHLTQCWLIVNWTLRNKQWNSNLYTKLFFHQNVFENDICEIAAILFRTRWLYIKRYATITLQPVTKVYAFMFFVACLAPSHWVSQLKFIVVRNPQTKISQLLIKSIKFLWNFKGALWNFT